MDTSWINTMSGNRRLCIFVIFFACIPPSWSTGNVEVTLLGFHNPTGLDRDGRCCDEFNIPGCPLGKCDHKFELCLRDIMDACVTKTGPEDNNSPTDKTLDFKALFKPDILEKNYTLSIMVTDVDSHQEVPVDTININITTRDMPSINITATGERKLSPTKIEVLVDISSESYFYQADCSKRCVNTNDCTGHFTCDDQTGDKICTEGWTGSSCKQLIFGSVADCSVYKDSGFVSNFWIGSLFCSDANRSTSMHITHITEDNDTVRGVSGYVTIDQLTTYVTGTFSDLTQHILLNTTSAVVGTDFSISGFSLDASMKKDSYMSGIGELNGAIKCIITYGRVEVCTNGYFGLGCTKRCHCYDVAEVCNKTNGHCDSGCIAGKQGFDCQTDCTDGSFGRNCSKKCLCLKPDEACNRTTGHCESGCTPGKQGEDYQTDCGDYTYGDSCLNQCEVCNKVTGACNTGQHTTSAPSGQHTKSGEQNVFYPPLLGIVVGAFCILIIVLVVVNVRLKRQVNQLKTEKEQHYISLRDRDDTSVYDVISGFHPYVNEDVNAT